MGYSSGNLLSLCKTFHRLTARNVPYAGTHVKQQIRWHGSEAKLYYRTCAQPAKEEVRLANAFGAFFWGWIVYNFLTVDYNEFLGPFMPDPSKWTDEELGIPPEDEE